VEPSYFLLALGAVAVVELALSGTWNQFYFSTGLPLFRAEVSLPRTQGEPPGAERLQGALQSKWLATLLFRKVSPDTMAFREKAIGEYFRLSYTPIMHGLVRFNRSGASFSVTGYANWTGLALIVYVLSLSIAYGKTWWSFFALFGVVGGVCYAIQARRFRGVANAVEESWGN